MSADNPDAARPPLDHERVDPDTRLLTILSSSNGDGVALAREYLALYMGRPPLREWLIERLTTGGHAMSTDNLDAARALYEYDERIMAASGDGRGLPWDLLGAVEQTFYVDRAQAVAGALGHQVLAVLNDEQRDVLAEVVSQMWADKENAERHILEPHQSQAVEPPEYDSSDFYDDARAVVNAICEAGGAALTGSSDGPEVQC